MVLSFVYFAFAARLRLLIGGRRSEIAEEVERRIGELIRAWRGRIRAGLPADRGRTAEARRACLAEHGASAAPGGGTYTGAAAELAELARVPTPAAASALACDFFTVETVLLRRY